MKALRILLITAVIISVTGCSALRGEPVETGFSPSVDRTVEQASSPVLARTALAVDPVELGREDATASFDFQARELYSGSIVEGAELFGQGKVLVTFVQPGCDITVNGGPTIAEIAEGHPEAIFVIVHSGADDDAYKAFAEEAMLFQENMTHLSDTSGSLAKRYTIDAYPTTLLIDTDMRITAVTGAMDEEAHRQAVEAVTTRAIAE